MSPDVQLKSATRIFKNTINLLMKAHGIDYDTCTVKQVQITIAECIAEFDVIWADLMQFVEFGDDERAKTLNVIRTSLSMMSMWR